MKRFAIPKEIRKRFAPTWALTFQSLKSHFARGELTSAQLCAEVLQTVWKDAFAPNPTSGKSQYQILKPRLRFLPIAVNDVLERWHRSEVSLILLFHKPTPQEVLEHQCQGKRIVSLLIELNEILEFEEHDRDFAGFLIHDLLHANHFFTSEEGEYERQVQFSNWMRELTNDDGFQQILKYGPQVQSQFEYLFSDMNTHTWHLLKTLKSHFDQHQMNEVELRFVELLPEDLKSLWPQINTPQETREFIEDFLSKMLRETPVTKLTAVDRFCPGHSLSQLADL